jgi:hypothetical protein
LIWKILAKFFARFTNPSYPRMGRFNRLGFWLGICIENRL